MPREHVLIPAHHDGYISWETSLIELESRVATTASIRRRWRRSRLPTHMRRFERRRSWLWTATITRWLEVGLLKGTRGTE